MLHLIGNIKVIDIWGGLENVNIPIEKKNKLSIFFYHKYGSDYNMDGCRLQVWITESKEAGANGF